MKRFYLFCLALALCNMVARAYDFIADDIAYTITSDTTVGVASGSTTTDTTITIPETVSYDGKDYTVTSLEDEAFTAQTQLRYIHLPSTLTALNGSRIFFECTSLRELTIPDGVTTIGSLLCYGCTALEAITLPEGLTTIPSSMCQDCTLLDNVIIPSTVTTINSQAFVGCTRLSSISIPDNVETIGTSVFSNCTALTEITISPNSHLISVGTNGFRYTAMSEITLPEALESLGSYAFGDCSNLLSVTSYNVTPPTLGTSVFRNLNSSCVLYVPYAGYDEYLAADGWDVFANIVPIGDDTTHNEDNTFVVDDITYRIVGADDNVVVTWGGNSSIVGTTAYTGTMTIPETVLYNNTTYTVVGIDSYAFYACTIEGLQLPATVTALGDYACAKCTLLVDIDLTAVTTIDNDAFWDCTALRSVTLSKGLTAISDNLFCNCAALTDITLPDAVERVGDYAFQNSALRQITLSAALTTIGAYAFQDTALQQITLPAALTTIGAYAFQNTALQQVELAETITSVGAYAFSDCSLLTSISLGEGLTTIPAGLCAGCTSLATVDIPSTITTINDEAFSNCTALTMIQLPADMATINADAFAACTALQYVYSSSPTPPTCNATAFRDANVNKQCTLLVPSAAIALYAEAEVWKEFYHIVGSNTPIVYALAPTCVTKETMILNGSFTLFDTSEPIVACGFEWWLTANDKRSLTADYDGASDFSALVEGIEEGNVYTYRAYVTTATDTVYSAETLVSTTAQNADFYADGLFYHYADVAQTCEVTYGDDYNTYSGDIIVPATVTHNGADYTVVGISDSAFRECVALTSITMPITVEYIDVWAFNACTALTEVVIPDGVTTISSQAFSDCEALATLTIGESVTSIGTMAFSCPSLLSLSSASHTPPSCVSNTFNDVDKSACILYVPIGTSDAYAAATAWKDFLNIVEVEGLGIEAVNALPAMAGIVEGYFTPSGQKLSAPQKGINIVHYTDGTAGKVLIK